MRNEFCRLGPGWGRWLDRLLLMGILLAQILIFLRLGEGRSGSSGEATAPAPVEAGTTEARAPGAAPPGRVRPDPFMAPVLRGPDAGFEAMVEQMNLLMADAIRDMDSMSRLLSRTDQWPHLAPSPTLDMREDDRAYRVVVSLPGRTMEDVRVMLEGRDLTLSLPHGPGGSAPHAPGRYRQVVRLPGPVGDPGEATATVTNGVLRVTVPKGIARPMAPRPGLRLF